MSIQQSPPKESPSSSLDDPIESTVYVEKSCLLFHVRSPLRRKIISIITSQAFDNFITFLIIANCVFLAIDGPTDIKDPANPKQQAIYYAEYVFLILFTGEMVLKIIGLGFCVGPETYLKNQWNWLDFSVVIIGYIGFVEIPGFPNLSALRTFRVLRPLRTLTTVPGMKVIVVSMISALPALSGVVLLTLGMFFVWSVIGLQLWGGIMESRCYYPPTRQFDIPLMRCSSSSSSVPLTGFRGGCNSPVYPTDWTCVPVTPLDVYHLDDAGTSTRKYTQVYSSHTFVLNRTTGLAQVDAPSSSSSTGAASCDLACPEFEQKNVACRSNVKYQENQDSPAKLVPVEIMLNLNQSSWITTGELMFQQHQWPVPRNLVDRPLNEKERHGINVTATIEKLRVDQWGNVDVYGSEANKTVELVLYPGIAFTGGWDHGTLCGLPNSQGVPCGTEQNGTVVVQGKNQKNRKLLWGVVFCCVFAVFLLCFFFCWIV